MTLVDRNCPLCGHGEWTTSRIVAGWTLATCRRCDFLFAPTIRESTATELDLADDYTPTWRARHRQIHRLLEHVVRPGETIVDVGAGFGELGLVARERGVFDYVGFEPSATVAAAARRRGVDIRDELFVSTSLPDEVGAVVLDNVIEHVADPVALLVECVNALRPGGALAVIVPNRDDLRRWIPSWRDANHWIPPEHINYFTPHSIRRLMEQCSLDVEPFGFAALDRGDTKYWLRALGERVGLFPFGLNFVGVKRP